MPLSRNNMPLLPDKDGLLTRQINIDFYLKKVAEKFGGFEYFLYLCNILKERDSGHPVQLVWGSF